TTVAARWIRIYLGCGRYRAVNKTSPLDALEDSMSQGAYPISRFLQRIIHNSGLRPSEFVQGIGYHNVAKGLRRVQEWLESGNGETDCLQRIVDAFNPDPAELETALAETDAIHEQERFEALREAEERARKQ